MDFLEKIKRQHHQSKYPDWRVQYDLNGVAEEIIMDNTHQRIVTKEIRSYKIYPEYWELYLGESKITIRAKPNLLDSIFRGIHNTLDSTSNVTPKEHPETSVEDVFTKTTTLAPPASDVEEKHAHKTQT